MWLVLPDLHMNHTHYRENYQLSNTNSTRKGGWADSLVTQRDCDYYDKWDIRGYLWQRYSVTVNQFVMAADQLSKWLFPIFQPETISSFVSWLWNPGIKHKIWNIYALRMVKSICNCCWNVDTYRWKVYDGNIEIISFVVKFRLQPVGNDTLYLWYP